MGGSSNNNSKANRINSYQIQSSAYGNPIPWGCGAGRIDINLMFLDGFTPHEHQQHSGGKGGGNSTNDTYTYTADVLLGICDTASGPIRGINQIFRDRSVFSGFANGSNDSDPTLCVKKAGLSALRVGTSGQNPSTLFDNYPDADKLGYDTISYLVGSQYQLNDQGGLQNHSVEVYFACQVGGGIVDANPGDYGGAKGIVRSFLGAMIPQWSASYIGDLDDYGTYCLASGLLLSPVLDSQQQASSVIDEIMLATNSECWIRGDGTLQVKTRADAPVTNNGVTYTPDLTPLYDLSDGDFIVDNPDDDPIKIDTPQLDDLYNIVQVTYKNRQHQYNDETTTGFDQASIDDIGQRKQDPTQIGSIKDPFVARLVAQLLAQRYSSLARPFTFNLPWCFARLEEMDLVTVTNESQDLDRVLCRITEIDKDGDTGKLTIKAIEVLVGTANAPVYPSQIAGGVVTDPQTDPGNVNTPVLFIPPTTITNGALQVWAAIGSTNTNWGGADVWVAIDDGAYAKVGTVQGRARYGVSTTDLPAHGDPDTGDSVGVDLSISGSSAANPLLSASQSEVDALVTLCWLGGELIAYKDARLTGTDTYALESELRRGAYGSVIEEHPAGTPFVRLDVNGAIFKYTFLPGQLGKTLHVKFPSFNVFGNNVQALEDVVDYTLLLAEPNLPGGSTLSHQAPWAGTSFTVVATAASLAQNYIFRIYDQAGITVRRQSYPTPALTFTYTADMAIADGVLDRTYLATVQAVNGAGDGPESGKLTVSNPAPAAITGIGKTGSGGSYTFSWTANAESDLAGYVAYYSQTNGFDPAQGQGVPFYQGQANTGVGLSGLTVGQTYYVRVAAYDTWSSDVRLLNFSAQFGFTA